MRTARFWIWWNSDWVKITLKPEQKITLHYGGPTDEGWSYNVETYENVGDGVESVLVCEACDCDGRLDTYRSFWCPYSGLRSVWCGDGEDIPTPNWRKKSASQRDYAAEAMGY